MTSTIDIKVTKENHNLSDRELRTLEVLCLNLVNFANFVFNRIGTAYNPLEKEKDDIFNYRVAFETTITEKSI